MKPLNFGRDPEWHLDLYIFMFEVLEVRSCSRGQQRNKNIPMMLMLIMSKFHS